MKPPTLARFGLVVAALLSCGDLRQKPFPDSDSGADRPATDGGTGDMSWNDGSPDVTIDAEVDGCSPDPVGLTCANKLCGATKNNCGATIQCACAAPEVCGGGGPNHCGLCLAQVSAG